MEAIGIAAIPVVAVYVGWTMKMMLETVKLQSATAAKLEAVTVEVSHQGNRIDALILSRLGS